MSRAEEARARAADWDLLALGLSPPSEALAEAIARAAGAVSLPAVRPRALTAEYHRLFVGPGPLAAPPYESVYREGGRVMGEAAFDVQRHYAAAGYALDPAICELPDHAAAELAFMALLCEEEARTWEAEDTGAARSWLERERAFLDDHLVRWLPAFCDRLLAATDTPLYRALAVALREFVALDAERVRALTGLLAEARV